MSDELIFPKTHIDPKLIHLQKEVSEFVTSVIIKHEEEFYLLVKKNFNNTVGILGYTHGTIISMITETTNKFYNEIYLAIQNQIASPLTNFIIDLAIHAEYGPHILLDKLIRLTIEIHFEMIREQLILDNLDLYKESVLKQINQYLSSCKLIHILSKGPNDDIPFVNVPDDQKPFNIVIDKNVGN